MWYLNNTVFVWITPIWSKKIVNKYEKNDKTVINNKREKNTNFLEMMVRSKTWLIFGSPVFFVISLSYQITYIQLANYIIKMCFSLFFPLQLWTGIDHIISFSFALKMIGMQFFGRLHSGEDDARNLARLVCKMTRAGIELTINSDSDQFKISS